ncbi:MAG: hypothetical protein MSS21_13900 [Parabacteroides sp.]|nr:hypothetical protein [Parabacteroides sp.]
MDRFIPINKKSKKAQKEYYAKKRNTWGEFNPMTRTMPFYPEMNEKGHYDYFTQAAKNKDAYADIIDKLLFGIGVWYHKVKNW